ncbi:myosin-2 essential light chain [Drosophila pseudoobscura]|uniref:Myosin-2 essential light chain n=1 Tax=Drosophila pseudoobscura pseudoobscura TaxID=46245 RepID=A0A6I8UK19_DROPS|nr:myosin-2 essential light chain [Drosophila pseudoobscura]
MPQEPKPKSSPEGHLPGLQQAFRHYELHGDGKISVLLLGDCLRAMGANPPESLVQRHVRKLQAASIERLSFELVLGIYFGLGENSGIVAPGQARGKAEEYICSLRLLDEQGTGFLPAGRLRRLLTECGEPLSEEEVAGLLKDRVNDQGLVNYVDLMHAILS